MEPTLVVNEWLTAAEAAAYLKVEVRTLLKWTRKGQLKGYSLSGSKRRVWRYLRADLDAALFGNPVVIDSQPGFRSHETEMIQ